MDIRISYGSFDIRNSNNKIRGDRMKKVIVFAIMLLFVVACEKDTTEATKSAEETTNQTGE